ncbi:MAG: TOBE domain-containing protein, partial [Alphaproteobacteria bacterium]|nr:TOBE domain-containing protein [Alphaproteobacteria bacterium]
VEAMTMGERICIMNDGVVVQVGKPMEVYRNPADTFVAGFLASPPMNLIAGRLESSGAVTLAAVTGDLRLPIPDGLREGFANHAGKPVIIGMRPEDLHLDAGAARHMAPVALATIATEVLGPEVILVASLAGAGGHEIHARMPRDFHARPGEPLTLHFDLSQIQLFDPATTRALPRPIIT